MNDMSPINDNITKPATIVNGINVDDLAALAEMVSNDPDEGMTNWQVTTTWQGQTRSRSEVKSFGIGGVDVPRHFAFDVDEPTEIGGTNQFANPQEYLIGAVNACIMVGYVAQCALRGIEIESLRIETTGDIDLRGFLGLDPAVANGYEQLSYRIMVKADADPETLAEVHEAVKATSPNYFNMANAVTMHSDMVIE